MADSFSIDLRGEEGLLAALAEMKKSTRRAAIRKAQRRAVKPIQLRARAAAPRRSGGLKRSIKIRAMKRSRKRFGVRVTTSGFDNAFAGEHFYGAFVEYGWLTGPRPGRGNNRSPRRPIYGELFMYRSANALAARTTQTFAKAAADEIERAAIKAAQSKGSR